MVFALSVLLAPVASAGSVVSLTPPDTRTITIPDADWAAFQLSIGFAGAVSLSVRVISGSQVVDVYTTEPGGYAEYSNPASLSFTYLRASSAERQVSFDTTITQSGTVIVIIDNAAITVSGANPTGPVTVTLTFASSSAGLLGYAVCGVIGIVVILILVLRARSRAKKRQQLAQMPPPVIGPPPLTGPPPPSQPGPPTPSGPPLPPTPP